MPSPLFATVFSLSLCFETNSSSNHLLLLFLTVCVSVCNNNTKRMATPTVEDVFRPLIDAIQRGEWETFVRAADEAELSPTFIAATTKAYEASPRTLFPPPHFYVWQACVHVLLGAPAVGRTAMARLRQLAVAVYSNKNKDGEDGGASLLKQVSEACLMVQEALQHVQNHAYTQAYNQLFTAAKEGGALDSLLKATSDAVRATVSAADATAVTRCTTSLLEITLDALASRLYQCTVRTYSTLTCTPGAGKEEAATSPSPSAQMAACSKELNMTPSELEQRVARSEERRTSAIRQVRSVMTIGRPVRIGAPEEALTFVDSVLMVGRQESPL